MGKRSSPRDLPSQSRPRWCGFHRVLENFYLSNGAGSQTLLLSGSGTMVSCIVWSWLEGYLWEKAWLSCSSFCEIWTERIQWVRQHMGGTFHSTFWNFRGPFCLFIPFQICIKKKRKLCRDNFKERSHLEKKIFPPPLLIIDLCARHCLYTLYIY